MLEKFGLKVSNLYISQVKTKCGIIELESYDKGKKEAVMDALKHFKMI